MPLCFYGGANLSTGIHLLWYISLLDLHILLFFSTQTFTGDYTLTPIPLLAYNWILQHLLMRY